jgi:hypothetical protein
MIIKNCLKVTFSKATVCVQFEDLRKDHKNFFIQKIRIKGRQSLARKYF